jgi:hypothetical protein
MGSIVKSIGRVFKGIGKTLKKIAPVLLVAAAVYVGYGFATGFTGVGWPTITGWGKSLMGGVSSGSTVSQAAAQATQASSGVASQVTAAEAAAPTALETAASSALETAAGAGTQQPGVAGGMLSSMGGEVAGGNASVVADYASGITPPSTFNLSTLTGTGPALESLGTQDLTTVADAVNASYDDLGSVVSGPDLNLNNPQTWIQIAGQKAGEAWKAYKELWKSDPLIAMYGTNQVIKMVAELMKKDEEQKEYGGMSNEEFRQVLAANPRTTPTVAQIQQKYGRGVPTGQMSARPNSGQVQQQVSRQYSEPLARRSQGLIGPKTQGQLA